MRAIRCLLVLGAAGLGCAAPPDTGNLGLGIAEAPTCPSVLTTTANQTDACNVAGTNPHDCTGTPGGVLNCAIRAGNKNTKTCDSGPTLMGIVVSQDQASFGWEQDTVSMCCENDATYTLAVKTCAATTGINMCNPGDETCGCPAGGPPCPCPADHYCSSCGDGGTDSKCVACFGIANLATCGLTVSDETCSAGGDALVCRHACPYFPGLAPPTVSVGAPITLWPPDHKLYSFTLAACATATDDCGGPLDVNAQGVITGASPGVTVTGPHSFTVRAEREGNRDGRIAKVQFTVSDSSGIATAATCEVVVPHDQGQPHDR